ncbi:MAG: carbohydrate kinase family protein [Anaerolineaceae bacterium]|nr:carbohydrate kinase family protein [Anaerolineaceae bacterium]
MNIVLTGSTAFDYLMKFPGYFRDHILPEHLDKISLSFLVDDMVRQRGGVAPNIAYTLALLGANPRLISNAGQDFGEYKQVLEKIGVDTSSVEISPDKFTASFFVNTDRSNAQIASFYAGAMADAAKISLLDKKLTKDNLVVISPNDPKAMVQYSRECVELGVPYVYDPGQQIVRMDGNDLDFGVRHAHALFVNEYEFQLLQKHTALSESEILSFQKFSVITLGESGSRIFIKNEESIVPAIKPGKLVDPTGVGDAYRGGFLRGYKEGWPLELCGQMGALAATYCLEQSGTQNHFYSKQEFISRFRESFNDLNLLDAIL